MDSEVGEKLFRGPFSIPLIILQSLVLYKTQYQATMTVLRVSTDRKFNEQCVIRSPKSYTYRKKTKLIVTSS